MNRTIAFRRLLAAVGAMALVAACNQADVAKLVGVPANDVYITAGAPQAGPNGDTVYFDIRNEGIATAYLQPCGTGPLLDLQVYQSGAWQAFNSGSTCPVATPSGAIELDTAADLIVTSVFPAGQYRVGVYVGTTAALSSVTEALTAPFTVP